MKFHRYHVSYTFTTYKDSVHFGSFTYSTSFKDLNMESMNYIDNYIRESIKSATYEYPKLMVILNLSYIGYSSDKEFFNN